MNIFDGNKMNLSDEEFKKLIKEHEEKKEENKKWLISRGWDESELERIDKRWPVPYGKEEREINSLVKAVSKEYEKLLDELGWFNVSSVNVVNIIPQFKKGTDIRTGRYKFYKNKIRKYATATLRVYNPNKKIFHTYSSAHYFARHFGENYSREDIKGVDDLMTNELDRKKITLEPNDLVAFSVCGSDTDPNNPKFHYKYVDKMNYSKFRENKRFHTAQWIKKAKKNI